MSKNRKITKPRVSPRKTREIHTNSVPVVGIGASAGGLEAITQLLTDLPENTGFAFVVILHLDPVHASTAPEILARTTRMRVSEIKNRMAVKPDHLYVIPPNYDVTLSNGKLKLARRSGVRSRHMPVDLFLTSLAKDAKDQSIGIILSGTASDGTLGLRAIKNEGGITFAQKPATAKYDGMPRSAILSGAVDIVASPKEIALELKRIATHPYVRPHLQKTSATEQLSDETEDRPIQRDDPLGTILGKVNTATQLDFSQYKSATINRRIKRRMALRKIDNLEAYSKLVLGDPDEAKALSEDLLICVTQFFRDPKVFDALKTRVFPKFIKNHPRDLPIRIWVPGCATGEEAYSIAIVLLEYLEAKRIQRTIQILATDISESSIQKARIGFFPKNIRGDVTKLRLQSYFDEVEGGYRIRKSVRDLCLFSNHDVTRDPPFSKIDLVSCRNLLIYFNAELQKRVVPIFHYALNPEGFLLLGRAETISGFPHLFNLTDKTNKIYEKREYAGATKARFSMIPFSPTRLLAPGQPAVYSTSKAAIQKEADRLALEKYAPPSVLVDGNLDIIMTRGRTSPFLELSPGQPSLNLMRMLVPELAIEVRRAIDASKKSRAPTEKKGLQLRENGEIKTISLWVMPLTLPAQPKEKYFSIEFEEESGVEPRAAGREPEVSKVLPRAAEKRRLAQKELLVHQQYQTLMDDFESTREELVAANEELQSSNEELQSTNEELETAKEELQSGNEELSTVNEELQTRNTEYSQLYGDLNNLLTSIDIPVIMVGNDTRIRRYTPRATKVLSLIPSDVGRPIGDIKPKIKAVDLEKIVLEVMESMATQVIETQDQEGVWHKLVARPYRTPENKIDGAVVALFNIDEIKRSALELQKSRDDAQTIIESLPIPLLVVSADLRINLANQSFYNIFKVTRVETEGRLVSELGSGQWNIPALLTLVRAAITRGTSFLDFEVDHNFPRIGKKFMLLNARKITLAGSGRTAALLAIEDITQRKRNELELKDAKERYENLLMSAHDSIIVTNEKGTIEFVNNRVKEMFGYKKDELIGKAFDVLVPERHRKTLSIRHRGQIGSENQPSPGMELTCLRKDGSELPIDLTLSPMKHEKGVLVTAIIRDVTYRAKIEKERSDLLAREKAAREEAEAASRTKDIFLATLSHELRTPLTTILSWAHLIREGIVKEKKTQHGMKLIEESAFALGQLINDLMDVSRIQSGKLPLDKKLVDASEIVTSAVEAVRLAAENNAVTLKIHLIPNPELLLADPARLKQVVLNLLTNAITFSSPGDKIEVRLDEIKSKVENQCRIRVIDHGKGIEPKFLPKIFERFTQEDSSSIRVHAGLGLGLAIVRGITEMHGGTVTAHSLGLGKGATFTILLPTATSARQTEGSSIRRKSLRGATLKRKSRTGLSGLRVLLVDDEANALEAHGEMIRSHGAKVFGAASADEAIRAMASFKPDVLVSDIAMPVRDGYSLIRQVRKLTPKAGRDTLAIALTAYANIEDQKRALEAGFEAHLAKPFRSEELAALITERLSARAKKPKSPRHPTPRTPA